MRFIYPVSSCKNAKQPTVVKVCRADGHKAYDFHDGDVDWRAVVDPAWAEWDLRTYVHHLENHPAARTAFQRDADAIAWADTCILVLPAGRSAHLEAGFIAGMGKDVIVLLDENDPIEPELMNLLLPGANGVRFVFSIEELRAALRSPSRAAQSAKWRRTVIEALGDPVNYLLRPKRTERNP